MLMLENDYHSDRSAIRMAIHSGLSFIQPCSNTSSANASCRNGTYARLQSNHNVTVTAVVFVVPHVHIYVYHSNILHVSLSWLLGGHNRICDPNDAPEIGSFDVTHGTT
jgi:hypothetical protein